VTKKSLDLDGRGIDAIGETLALLRRNVRSVTESTPWVLDAAEVAARLFADLAELATGNIAVGCRATERIGMRKGQQRVGDTEEEDVFAPVVLVSEVAPLERNSVSVWKESVQ